MTRVLSRLNQRNDRFGVITRNNRAEHLLIKCWRECSQEAHGRRTKEINRGISPQGYSLTPLVRNILRETRPKMMDQRAHRGRQVAAGGEGQAGDTLHPAPGGKHVHQSTRLQRIATDMVRQYRNTQPIDPGIAHGRHILAYEARQDGRTCLAPAPLQDAIRL